jgi:hypothetical protein
MITGIALAQEPSLPGPFDAWFEADEFGRTLAAMDTSTASALAAGSTWPAVGTSLEIQLTDLGWSSSFPTEAWMWIAVEVPQSSLSTTSA